MNAVEIEEAVSTQADRPFEAGECAFTFTPGLRQQSDDTQAVARRRLERFRHRRRAPSQYANARLDPTFLMAEVETVAACRLCNVDCGGLETFGHRIVASARLDIEIEDRFDNTVMAREWFRMPLEPIDDAVGKIREETITHDVYDLDSVSLVGRP